MNSFTEVVVTNHFYVLLDLLMAVGHSKTLELAVPATFRLFRALEFGLLGEEVSNAWPPEMFIY